MRFMMLMALGLVACSGNVSVEDPDSDPIDKSPTPIHPIPHCQTQATCRVITQPNGAAEDFCCGLPMWYTATGGQCINQACNAGDICYVPTDDAGTLQGSCL